MAHEITDTDNIFTVRRPAWHGLGEVFPDYPTRVEAQAIALPWEPISEPVYRREPVVLEDGTIKHGYRKVEGFQAIARSDNAATLGVVTDTYEPVGNNELFEIAEAIEGIDKGSVRYETGGSLKGGRKVWLLLALEEPLVISGDPNGAVIPYFALQNSHDGSGAFRGQSIMERIVCANTSHAADIEASQRGTEFTFRHTKNVAERVTEAQEALSGWRHSVREYQRVMESLLDMEITEDQQQWFVETFIPMPPPHLSSPRVEGHVTAARGTLNAILGSVTCADISRTSYGLVQAATEYQGFYRAARSDETRFKRMYLDRSKVIEDAVALAKLAVTV